MSEYKIMVLGMSCAHCEKKISGALAEAGAENVKIDLEKGEVILSCGKSGIDAIVEKIEDAGYDVVKAQKQ